MHYLIAPIVLIAAAVWLFTQVSSFAKKAHENSQAGVSSIKRVVPNVSIPSFTKKHHSVQKYKMSDDERTYPDVNKTRGGE